jgi:hypothetical protein
MLRSSEVKSISFYLDLPALAYEPDHPAILAVELSTPIKSHAVYTCTWTILSKLLSIEHLK